MKQGDTQKIALQWDAGESGCGQLVLGLKKSLGQIQPGECLQVLTRDAGAPSDLPAWCRMTGHVLILADHPVYVLQKRGSEVET